jgi:hypothetical protein
MSLLCMSVSVHARICTSTGNGNWTTESTWSCPGVPMPGDTVIIQAAHTVTLGSNLNFSGEPMHIMVYGTWNFSGGGSKISLPCGSYIEILDDGVINPDPSYQGFSETVRICNVTYWNTMDGPQTGYQIWPGPPTPLPVSLLSFSAFQVDAQVQLAWSTGSERDVEAFLVQRIAASDGEVHLVGRLPAAGNSIHVQEYTLADRPTRPGRYYYQLIELDLDGSEHELATVVTSFEGNQGLRCSPNPLSPTDALVVTLPLQRSAVDVQLVGISGQWMHPAFVEVEGALVLVLDGLPVKNGIHTLQVRNGEGLVGTCRLVLE